MQAFGHIERINNEAHVAVENLIPEHRDELPLTKDQIVNVLKKESGGWWLAQDPATKKFGWVPADFLQCKYRIICIYILFAPLVIRDGHPVLGSPGTGSTENAGGFGG